MLPMAPKPWKSAYVPKKSGKPKNSTKGRKTRKLTNYTHSIQKLGPRAFLRGLWVTRCVYEALQALPMALWASRCQKMLTFWFGPEKMSIFFPLKKPKKMFLKMYPLVLNGLI